MKIDIIYGKDVFVLPKDEVIKKLDSVEMIDLKLLLLITADESCRNDFNADTVAKQLNCSKSEVEASLKFWIGADVLKSSDNKTVKSESSEPKQQLLLDDETPNYTGKEINEMIANNKDLSWLIHECQNITGKILNTMELNKILAMKDYLRLEHEHILMIFIYCKNQGKVAIPYIMKFTQSLYDDGIDTLAKFEMYIKSREEYADTAAKMKRLFGIGDRSLTPKETGYFNRWCLQWIFSYEIIERAYEITIDGTDNHKLSYPYMNKVLDNWYKEGCKTLEEVEALIAIHQQDKEKPLQPGSSFDTDEFFELAVKRTYEKIEKNKEV